MEQSFNDNVAKDRRIAKNTLIMYGRMLLVTLVTLFTVRIALKTLGVEDYGLYNAVAGLVTFASFVSISMQIATMRFYSYTIGEKDAGKRNAIFNLNIFIYSVIVVLVIVLAETVGLWFLKNEMTIPAERLIAVLWIYQLAVLSFVVTLIAIPFSSMIIAHEHIGVYAVIGLIEAILKLLILLVVLTLPFDRLIVYGLLMLAVTLIKEGISVVYCKKKYEECYFRFVWDSKLFKTVYSYSGWTLFGSLAGVAYNQGSNILINIFFGPVANAAKTVAFQVSNTMQMLSTNFFTVISPQIIKSHAANDHMYMMSLFYFGSKFSYFLLFAIFLPLLFEAEYVLNIWLGGVSNYMVMFTRLSLVATLILSMHSPITTLIQAVGAVKKYHVIVESVLLLSLPLTYLFFKLGYAAEYTFYISIVVFLIAHLLRVLVLRNVMAFSMMDYLKKFVLPIFMVTVLSLLITICLYHLLPYGFGRFAIVLVLSIVSVSLLSFLFGLNNQEKQQLKSLIKSKF